MHMTQDLATTPEPGVYDRAARRTKLRLVEGTPGELHVAAQSVRQFRNALLAANPDLPAVLLGDAELADAMTTRAHIPELTARSGRVALTLLDKEFPLLLALSGIWAGVAATLIPTSRPQLHIL
jgi:hypothetical protein